MSLEEIKRLYIKDTHKGGKNYLYRPYYHGGPKGLKIIAPSSYTNERITYPLVEHYDLTKTYITTSLGLANLYAKRANGIIYEVLPFGDIERDPECIYAFTCDYAEVLREIDEL